MEYKSHKIRISNIPVEKKIYRTTDKSMMLVAFSWLVSAYLLFVARSVFGFLAVFYSICITFRGDNVIFDGYTHFFIMYDQMDTKYCDIIYHSEVARWTYHGDFLSPKITVFLRDGEMISITKGVDRTMKKYFQKVMRRKEDRIRTVRRMKDIL